MGDLVGDRPVACMTYACPDGKACLGDHASDHLGVKSSEITFGAATTHDNDELRLPGAEPCQGCHELYRRVRTLDA